MFAKMLGGISKLDDISALKGKPIIISNPISMKQTSFSTGFNTMSKVAISEGDIITAPYHTYNSIETQAPLVNQDENLSLSLCSNSKNAKVFVNPN